MLKKASGVRPEVYGSIVADMYFIKEAALPGLTARTKKLLTDIGTLSGAALVINTAGGLVNWGTSKVKEKKLEHVLENSYKEALKGSSMSAEFLRANPADAQVAFKTLSHFAPSVATNPVAARGFMAKFVDYKQTGGMEATDIETLTEIQKNMTGFSSPHPFNEGFMATSEHLGTRNLIHGGVRAAQADMLREMSMRGSPGNRGPGSDPADIPHDLYDSANRYL
jgi:hypothetical protein